MEITIGVKNLPRELVVETDQSADDAAQAVADAFSAGSALHLKDTRGRVYVVPVEGIGYVEIGTEETRRVGFGSV